MDSKNFAYDSSWETVEFKAPQKRIISFNDV